VCVSAANGSVDPFAQEIPPAVFPTATPRFADIAPTRLSSLKSGRLNVVEPSPAPKYVLVIANRLEYVDRDLADPSHKSHPLGGADGEPVQVMTEPVGISVVVDEPRVLQAEAPLIFISSVVLL